MSLTEADIEAIVKRKVQEQMEQMKSMRGGSSVQVTRALHEYIQERIAKSGLLINGWREYAQYDITMQVVKMALGKKSAHDFWSEEHFEAGKKVVDEYVVFLLKQRQQSVS